MANVDAFRVYHRMFKRFAITGGIACGKSLFSRELERLGVEVRDADEVVHALEAPGGEAVAALRKKLGPGIVGADGGIDRRALGERVFRDDETRAAVNAVLHPLVRERLLAWADTPGPRLKVAVIPLLFEAGWERDWDVVICLVCCEAVQRERLMRSRGLTEEEARLRIAAQWPVAEKAARSHYVVYNESDVAALAREADRIVRLLAASRMDHGGT